MPALFNTASSPWTLSVSLLKKVTVTLHTSDGLSYRVPIAPNSKRVQLLAYLAWRRDQKVSCEQILGVLFLPDLLKEKALSNEEFTRLWHSDTEERGRLSEELTAKFDIHKQLVRRDIRAALKQLNAGRGNDPLPMNIDPFEQELQRWWLSSMWQVTDLETVEGYARVIREAEEQHRLRDTVPESVKAACDALIAAYPGDFLADALSRYPEEFQPVETSWVREPYTHYRDCYLRALWYAGEYEWQRGRAGTVKRRWEHFARAAELFRRYAMSACDSVLDTGVSFGVEKYQEGVRVGKSEEAMCRSLVVYQADGRMQEFEERKQAYVQQMERISGGMWTPGDALREVVQSARGKATSTLTPATPEEAKLIKKLSFLESRTTQLALARLRGRERSLEQRIAALEIVLQELVGRLPLCPSPSADREASLTANGQPDAAPRHSSPHPGEERIRPRRPLIEYAAQGTSLLVRAPEGNLHLVPDSPGWFDWLATLTSFRFVGKQGHFSAYRESDRRGPTRSWRAHSHLHGHHSRHYLGTTDRLTIANLEQAAAKLQASLDAL